MKLTAFSRFAGVLIAVATLWATAGSLGTAFGPVQWLLGTTHAAPPVNPDNPDAGKAANPCNPDAARAANPCNPDAARAANPCNPDAARAANPCNPDAAQAANPCNPDAAQAANPCNPDAAQAANPCNPDAAQAANPCNPDAAQAANPCNPAAAAARAPGSKIAWGRDFKSWDAVTGYVISSSHGNRLVQTYIYPPEAAKVYKHNAELARLRKTGGYQGFPPGTVIAQESWLRNELGGPGRSGPVFFMRKEQSGYDGAGGDWRYGFARNDLSLVGEGHDDKMAFCKECHARASQRDHVYATER